MATPKKRAARKPSPILSGTKAKPGGDARSTVLSDAQAKYAAALEVFTGTAVEVDEAKRRTLANIAREQKVGHGDTARLSDGDTVVPGADTALITVCKGPDGRGMIVQRDIVEHPYLAGKKDWMGVRYAEFPTVEAAFLALDEIRRASGQLARLTKTSEPQTESDWDDLRA